MNTWYTLKTRFLEIQKFTRSEIIKFFFGFIQDS